MTCSTCGKPVVRPHRHGDHALDLRIRYGRLVAKQEREWIRQLYWHARDRLHSNARD